jgi:hypothetical protein
VGSQINTWWQSLPGTDQPAGPIRVSPNATARLEGGDDATVKPSDYQNQSTGSDVDLGFVWTVTPKKPTSHLILTAYIEVRLEGIPPPNDTITTVKTLDIAVQGAPPVPRPPLPEQIWGSIKDNTPVWSPFVGTGIFGGVVAWIVKKIRRRNQATDVGSSASATEETPTESAEPQGEAAGSKPSRAQTNDTDH